MVNKVVGNNTESKILKILKNKSFWCHLFAYHSNGQPCDIIALKDDKSMLLDAKHSVRNIFYLTRAEANQLSCFQYATQLGVKNCGFVIEYADNFYYLPYTSIKNEEAQKFIITKLKTFEEFLNEVDN